MICEHCKQDRDYCDIEALVVGSPPQVKLYCIYCITLFVWLKGRRGEGLLLLLT